MATFSTLRELDTQQRHVVVASFLGWTLDAFDFFIVVLALKHLAEDFHVAVAEVAFGITLTLAMRPLGAFVFGWLGERYGRRPILMIDIVLFSLLEFATAFAPSLVVFLILRALFGFAMGGEWGLGASLTLESIPEKARGIVSGLLQEGYAVGYLLASLVFIAVFDRIGWRGMFIVGALPALLVIYIRSHVPESPVWERRSAAAAAGSKAPGGFAALRGMWGRALFMIALMTAFNFFSHGSQDLFPTYLQAEHGYSTQLTGILTAIGSIGAICGGLYFGAWSQRIGRRRGIVIAALLTLPMILPWAFASSAAIIAIGAFAVQFMVQGAWGIVPVHLNELSPDDLRATLPGLTYQLGNLISSGTPTMLAAAAASYGGRYGLTMGVFIAGIALAVALIAWFGPEAKDKHFG